MFSCFRGSYSLGAPEVVRPGVQSVNYDCLLHAPCSVGILVGKSALLDNLSESFSHGFTKQFVMLFLGGADSREALAYADRTVGNPDIHLTVVRFLAQNYTGDDKRERKLDDGVVTSFWVKNEPSERVAYREVVVSSGAETIVAVQDMGVGSYDLWIVGKENGLDPVLLQGYTRNGTSNLWLFVPLKIIVQILQDRWSSCVCRRSFAEASVVSIFAFDKHFPPEACCWS